MPQYDGPLATSLTPYLHAGRESHGAFGAAVALCCNTSAPFAALQALLSPAVGKPQFRKVVARESRRADVLALLASDVSTSVAARAKARISG